MIRFPPQNLMLITFFYQLLLFIGDPILLGGFKLGDEVLDMPGLGSIYIEYGVDGDFILDDSHEFLVDLLMGHLEILF